MQRFNIFALFIILTTVYYVNAKPHPLLGIDTNIPIPFAPSVPAPPSGISGVESESSKEVETMEKSESAYYGYYPYYYGWPYYGYRYPLVYVG